MTGAPHSAATDAVGRRPGLTVVASQMPERGHSHGPLRPARCWKRPWAVDFFSQWRIEPQYQARSASKRLAALGSTVARHGAPGRAPCRRRRRPAGGSRCSPPVMANARAGAFFAEDWSRCSRTTASTFTRSSRSAVRNAAVRARRPRAVFAELKEFKITQHGAGRGCRYDRWRPNVQSWVLMFKAGSLPPHVTRGDRRFAKVAARYVRSVRNLMLSHEAGLRAPTSRRRSARWLHLPCPPGG